VRNVQDAIDQGKWLKNGKYSSRNSLQTTTLLDAIEDLNLMRVLVERVVMRKARAKGEFFRCVMILVNGMKKPAS
jgi:sulfate adenylyltransferase subunit 2